MTLHIFNPEHDIALAAGLDNFTAPHAGRQLRHDLGWLPVLWATERDLILVDDVEYAQRKLQRRKRILPHHDIQLRAWPQQTNLQPERIDVWGWNADIRSRLRRIGINEELLPDDEQLEQIRQLSHRRTSAKLLAQLTKTDTSSSSLLTGEAKECKTMEDVLAAISQWGHVVMKAPWSSSGRGIRFVKRDMSISERGWLKNILQHQGSVMLEPYYNKVKDFGMEFYSDGRGHVNYQGLSLFHTANGAYTGNLLATENHKREELMRFLPIALLGAVRQAIVQNLSDTIGLHYEGPFGIDMMIVSHTTPTKHFVLHPCVEINLRRTMGHVAIALNTIVNPGNDDDLVRVMRINYIDNQYKLEITRLK